MRRFLLVMLAVFLVVWLAALVLRITIMLWGDPLSEPSVERGFRACPPEGATWGCSQPLDLSERK